MIFAYCQHIFKLYSFFFFFFCLNCNLLTIVTSSCMFKEDEAFSAQCENNLFLLGLKN